MNQPNVRRKLRVRPWRRRDEQGSGGVEFLITVVVMLYLFAVLAQYGIRAHADRVADAAAREGAVALARFDGTPAAAKTTATSHLSESVAIRTSTVAASRTPTQATVEVKVEIVSLLLTDWLGDPITSVATTPVERFVP